MFKIFADRHIKTCRSLKRRAFWKALVPLFRRTYALSVGLKIKPLRKSVLMECIELNWLCKHMKKIRSSQQSFLSRIEWNTSLSLRISLRYYANFKERKLSHCSTKFYKIFAKNYHLHWIADRANILCKYIIYLFFQFWPRLLWLLFYVIFKKFSFSW